MEERYKMPLKQVYRTTPAQRQTYKKQYVEYRREVQRQRALEKEAQAQQIAYEKYLIKQNKSIDEQTEALKDYNANLEKAIAMSEPSENASASLTKEASGVSEVSKKVTSGSSVSSRKITSRKNPFTQNKYLQSKTPTSSKGVSSKVSSSATKKESTTTKKSSALTGFSFFRKATKSKVYFKPKTKSAPKKIYKPKVTAKKRGKVYVGSRGGSGAGAR